MVDSRAVFELVKDGFNEKATTQHPFISRAADMIGAPLARLLPWAFNFTTLVVARK